MVKVAFVVLIVWSYKGGPAPVATFYGPDAEADCAATAKDMPDWTSGIGQMCVQVKAADPKTVLPAR